MPENTYLKKIYTQKNHSENKPNTSIGAVQ